MQTFAEVLEQVVLCLFLINFDTSYLKEGEYAIVFEDLFGRDFIVDLAKVVDVLKDKIGCFLLFSKEFAVTNRLLALLMLLARRILSACLRLSILTTFC